MKCTISGTDPAYSRLVGKVQRQKQCNITEFRIVFVLIQIAKGDQPLSC